MDQLFALIKQTFKKLSKINFDFLFYLAAFTLPFENLFFAPSSGWATIAPLILFIYAFLNLYYLKSFIPKIRPIFCFFFIFSLLGTLTTIIFHGRLDDYLSSFIPIFLGLGCLLSFLELYAKHQKKDLQEQINRLVSIIIISYLLSLLIGLFEYFIIKYQMTNISDIFNFLFKRNYLAKNRIQFFFTEPSFIGMHLFGILLPLYWLSRRKDLLLLIFLFSYSAIFFGAGVRIILDILFISVLLAIYYLKKNQEKLFIPLTLIAFILFITSVAAANGRFHKIFFGFLEQKPSISINCDLTENQDLEECLTLSRKSGINADGSFASRVFRIKSTILGYTKAPLGFITGFGLGNSIYPARLGHRDRKSVV